MLAAASCESGGTPTGPSTPSTPPAPSAPAVSTLSLTGTRYFTELAQTSQFGATARFTDATERIVTDLAAWTSTRPDVASVTSTGLVTAVAAGHARITATHQGASASLDVLVPKLGSSPRTVRILYLVPQDRPFREDHRRAIQNAFVDLQAWYRDQLGGAVFTLHSLTIEQCRLPREAPYYAPDSWSRLVADVQPCALVSAGAQDFVWVLYADVVHACNAPGRLGAGAAGLTILGRGDIQGLAGEDAVEGDCGLEARWPVGRYIGGAGHELGHTFGLPHPPGCDAGLPSCDASALMWAGYAAYPNTYLRSEEKQALATSPYFGLALHRIWDGERLPR